MTHTLRWSMALLFLLVTVAGFQTGCGSGDECQKNGDCKDKPNPKNQTLVCKLVDGKRQCLPQTDPPTNTCPDACTDDLDCLNCTDGRTACIAKACAKPGTATQCPAACTSNSDCTQCPDGKTSCEGGTCTQPLVQCPSLCQSDADCKSCDGGRTQCASGTCKVPQNPGNCPSSCSKNSECTQCNGGNTYCVSGKCGTPPGTCPQSCSTEGDCLNCPAGLTACVNGRCTSSTQQCPSSCNTDDQCTPCSDGKTSCVAGVCTNPNSNCPATCINSSQCGLCPGGKTTCVNGTCQAGPTCPSFCSNDSDCTPCPDGKTSCVGGACNVPNNQGCPASCLNDSQCGLCTGGRNECRNGTCQVPACPSSCRSDSDCFGCPSGSQTCTTAGICGRAVCPASCAGDVDCGLCPNGRTACVGGSCQTPTTNCSICTRDSECAGCSGGRTACIGGQCTQPQGNCPSSCVTDTQCILCSGGRTSCVSGTCQASQCPAFCITDSECANCPNSRTKCSLSSFTCTTGGSSTGNAQVTEECGSTKTCATGLLCVTIRENNKSYCFQECQTNSNCSSNSDGRTSCIAFVQDSQGSIRSVCLAEQSKSQSCGFAVNKQQICLRNQDPALYCNKSGTCTEVVVQKTVGANCNKAGNTTEPIAVCDEKSGLACDDATSKCVAATQVNEAQACDPGGTILGKPTICKTGFDCITFDANNTIGRCHKICQPTSSGQCTHVNGLTCMRAFSDGRGLCFDTTCTSDSSCAFTGYRCQTPQAGGGNRCVPATDYGQVCGGFLECKTGLSCLTAPNAQESFCSKTCTTNTDCPSVAGKTFTCIVQGTSRFCLRRCTSDTDCPSPLTCETVGTSQFCAMK